MRPTLLVVVVAVVGAATLVVVAPAVILEVLETLEITATMVQEQLAEMQVTQELMAMQVMPETQTVVGQVIRVILEEQDHRVILGLPQTQI